MLRQQYRPYPSLPHTHLHGRALMAHNRIRSSPNSTPGLFPVPSELLAIRRALPDRTPAPGLHAAQAGARGLMQYPDNPRSHPVRLALAVGASRSCRCCTGYVVRHSDKPGSGAHQLPMGVHSVASMVLAVVVGMPMQLAVGWLVHQHLVRNAVPPHDRRQPGLQAVRMVVVLLLLRVRMWVLPQHAQLRMVLGRVVKDVLVIRRLTVCMRLHRAGRPCSGRAGTLPFPRPPLL